MRDKRKIVENGTFDTLEEKLGRKLGSIHNITCRGNRRSDLVIKDI